MIYNNFWMNAKPMLQSQFQSGEVFYLNKYLKPIFEKLALGVLKDKTII
jgi:hypothetical protein